MFAPQFTMHDIKHAFASYSVYFLSNFFAMDLATSPSTNAYIQFMYTAPAKEMGPKTLLMSFFILLSIGRLVYASASSSKLLASPLVSATRSLGLLENIEWEVPTEGTLMLKSAKGGSILKC